MAQFNADHTRHTGLVSQFFRAFYYESKTSPVLKATMRLVTASQ